MDCARTRGVAGKAHATKRSTAAVARRNRRLCTSGSKEAAWARAIRLPHLKAKRPAHQAVRLTKNVSKLSPVVADRTVVVAMMASIEPLCAISTVPATALTAPL